MFNLPPARKEWDCSDCKQRIYQSTKDKFRSGKYKILNAEDGQGGFRNMPHVCPKRVGSKVANRYDAKSKRWCSICDRTYLGVFAMCPNCFKLKCSRCGRLRDWRIDAQIAGCPCVVLTHQVEEEIYPNLIAQGITEVKSGYLYSDIVEVNRRTKR